MFRVGSGVGTGLGMQAAGKGDDICGGERRIGGEELVEENEGEGSE